MTETASETVGRWVLGLTATASFMVALDALVITTALTTIRDDLGASVAALEWTANAYLLSFAVLIVTASTLGDRFGRRRLFVTGIGLFAVASGACALAPTVGWLIAARAAQGIGEALVLPLGMTILMAAIPDDRRARALGLFSGVTGLAVLGGPVVGGAIVQGLDWRWIFWLNVPLGLVLIPLSLRWLVESHGRRSRVDIVGIVVLTVAVLGLMWGLVRGNTAGWTTREIVGALAVGVLSLAAFIVWERRTATPMLPLAWFRSGRFAWGNVAGFFLYASLFGTLFFLAQFMQVVMGYGPLGAGLRLLPWTATLFVTAPIAGALVARTGERPLVMLGLVGQATGMAWIAMVAEPGGSYSALVPPLMLAGFGVSMAMPATQSAVFGAMSASDIGTASGTFNMLRQLGAAFGIAALVVEFSRVGGYESVPAFSDGFSGAVGLSAALSVAGAVAGLGLPRRISPATVVSQARA